MATFMKTIYIPPELIDEICSHSDRATILSLMRTSNGIHVVSSRAIYNTICVSGLRARLLFVTMTSTTRSARICTLLVRKLTYRGTNPDDAFLGFSPFAEALLRMRGLQSLTINVSKILVKYLAIHLEKRGIIRVYQNTIAALDAGDEACVLALPNLTALTLKGDCALFSLATCRLLTTLIIESPMSITSLKKLVDNMLLNNASSSSHIQTLEVNLYYATATETAIIFISLAQSFPNLRDLTFRLPFINPLMIIDILADAAHYARKLQMLYINTDSRNHTAKPPCYVQDEETCTEFFARKLQLAGNMRTSFQQIQFGLQTWDRCPLTRKWKDTIEEDFLETRHPRFAVRNVYVMEGKPNQWTWVKGMQDCLSSFYDRVQKAAEVAEL